MRMEYALGDMEFWITDIQLKEEKEAGVFFLAYEPGDTGNSAQESHMWLLGH